MTIPYRHLITEEQAHSLMGTHPDFEGESVCAECGEGHDDE